MEEYKISLGAEISQQGLSNVKDQIKTLESNPIKLTLDKNLSNEIKAIKEQIDSLGSSKGKNKNALAINTESVEKSLNDIAVTIKEVRDALGTIDNKSGMKSLLSSINQITASLGKASDETQTLVSSLNALSKKDFSFNIGIDLNNKKSTLAYGREARQSVLPELKSQINYLNDLFDKELQGITRSKKINIDQSKVGLLGKVNKIKMDYTVAGGSSSSMIGSLEAQEKYINQMVELAKASDINLDGFYSQHSKSASQLVNELTGVSQATEVVEEQTQKLKNIFGSGIDSESLTQILNDLNEINTAIKTIASDTSLGGLTQSFDNLSNTLKEITRDISTFAQAVNSGLANASGSTNITSNIEKEAKNISTALESAGEKGAKAFTDKAESTVESTFDLHSFVEKEANRIAQEFGAGEKAVDDICAAMVNYLGNVEKAKSATSGLSKEFEKLTNKEMQDATLFDESYYKSKIKDAVLKGKSDVAKIDKDAVEVAKYISKYNSTKNGYKVQIPESIRQREDYNSMRRRLGSSFTSGSGTDLEDFIRQMNGDLGEVIDLNKGLDSAFDQLYAINERGKALLKGNKSDAGSIADSLSKSSINEVESSIERSLSSIEDAKLRASDAVYDKLSSKLDEVNRQIEKSEQELDSLSNQMAQIENAKKSGSQIDDGLERQTIEDFKSESANYDNLINQQKQLETSLSNIRQGLQESSEVAKQFGTSLDGAFENAENEAKQTADAIQEVVNETKKLDNVSIDISDGSIDDLRNALKNIKVDDSSIENATKELNELNIVAKSVSGTLKDGNLVKWDIKGAQTMSDGLERTVTITNTLKKGVWEVSEKYGQAFDKIADSAKKVKYQLADTGADGLTEKLRKAHTETEKYTASSVELQEALRRLDVAMESMNTADQASDNKKLVDSYKEWEAAIQQVYSQLKKLQNAEKAEDKSDIFALNKEKALQRLNGLFDENSVAARKFGAELQEIQKELAACGNTAGLDKVNKKIDLLQSKVKQSNVSTKSLGTTLKNQFQKFGAYFSVAELFMYVEQGLRDMFEQVKLIDSAMTELKKVTDETDASYNRFLKNAGTRAKEIGTTIDGLVQSTSQFARLGYGFEDAQGLAEVANIYAVVGDEVEGVEGATTSLISTMTAFKDEMNGLSNADFSMKIIDVFNELGNKFAISSGGLGEAFQRAASSMSVSGNTLSETASLITAANTVVQNPEKVGNAFKTISMRLRAAKTEMEELGEDTSGMAESTASLRAEMLALTGVDLMENETTFKSTFKFLQELSGKWEHLTDIQRANCLPDYIEIYN